MASSWGSDCVSWYDSSLPEATRSSEETDFDAHVYRLVLISSLRNFIEVFKVSFLSVSSQGRHYLAHPIHFSAFKEFYKDSSFASRQVAVKFSSPQTVL